jgi:hypothetical protein
MTCLRLVLAAVLAGLALPASVSSAPAKAPELRLSNFELESSNGYGVHVASVQEGDFAPDAIVSVDGGAIGVSYEVRAELGAGVRATFGPLGQLDVRFERRKKKVERPEPGCRWIFEKGVFRGSFQFTGEGGYTSSSAVNPEGEVLRLPNNFCGLGLSDRPARLAIPGFYKTVLAAQAPSGSGTVSFGASRLILGGAPRSTSFSASLEEQVGAMKIERTARANGGMKTFALTGTSRGSVSPPPPFRGSARFRDPAKGPARWTGSLSVSFPGAPDIALAGPSFAAKLCPRAPFLSRCLRR